MVARGVDDARHPDLAELGGGGQGIARHERREPGVVGAGGAPANLLGRGDHAEAVDEGRARPRLRRDEVELEGGDPRPRVHAEARREAVGEAEGLDAVGERVAHVPLAAHGPLESRRDLARLAGDGPRDALLGPHDRIERGVVGAREGSARKKDGVERGLDLQDAELGEVADPLLLDAQVEEARGARAYHADARKLDVCLQEARLHEPRGEMHLERARRQLGRLARELGRPGRPDPRADVDDEPREKGHGVGGRGEGAREPLEVEDGGVATRRVLLGILAGGVRPFGRRLAPVFVPHVHERGEEPPEPSRPLLLCHGLAPSRPLAVPRAA